MRKKKKNRKREKKMLISIYYLVSAAELKDNLAFIVKPNIYSNVIKPTVKTH